VSGASNLALGTTLVVPLDGSAFAETAVRPAVAFAARAAQGRVLLLTSSAADGDSARRYLEDRADRFRRVVDIGVEVIANGSPSDAILTALRITPGSMLCMSTHGHGGVRTALLGSVAQDVVCRSSGPILLVGPRSRTALLQHEVGDIVVTSDGSAFSEAILPHASAWARDLSLDPWIVEVVAPDELPNHPSEPPRNRQIEGGMARLQKLAAGFVSGGEATRFQVLHGADAAQAIVAFAERLPAAVVAMATHGRTGFARTVVGSIAANVVRRSPCPVLLVRPPQLEAAR
jgi:nucleotide-binding universal stress UspA family protein